MLAACTDITVLDEALLRPGRLQHHIKLDYPTKIDIQEILTEKMREMKCNEDVSVVDLGSILESETDSNVTGADVENLCRRALLSRIREEVKKIKSVTQNANKNEISDDPLRSSFKEKSKHIDESDGAGMIQTKNVLGKGKVESYEGIDICMRNFLEAFKECFPSSNRNKNSSEQQSAINTVEKPAATFAWKGTFAGGIDNNPR